MPVTSVAVLRTALESAGLTVRAGRAHLKVTTESGAYLGTVASTPSDWRSLRNSRSLIARRITEITTPTTRRAPR